MLLHQSDHCLVDRMPPIGKHGGFRQEEGGGERKRKKKEEG